MTIKQLHSVIGTEALIALGLLILSFILVWRIIQDNRHTDHMDIEISNLRRALQHALDLLTKARNEATKTPTDLDLYLNRKRRECRFLDMWDQRMIDSAVRARLDFHTNAANLAISEASWK